VPDYSLGATASEESQCQMIRFFVTRGHDYTLRPVRKRLPVKAVSYDHLFRSPRLPSGTYIFADIDRLSFWDLELAAHAFLEMQRAGVRVLNNPARVKTRYALLRALHNAGLNDFNIYRADELPDLIRYPVFLRKAQSHTSPLTDLLHDRRALDVEIEKAVAAGTPLELMVVTEFAAEPVREGLYRKLSAFRIGDEIIPHLSVHDTNWLVKYGQHGIAGEDWYQDELDVLKRNPHREHLQKVFEIAGIQYGRADFGIYKGRVQVYEINTNPALHEPGAHPSSTRVESMRLCWTSYLDSLRRLDIANGRSVRLSNGTLQRHRLWSNLFVRSRKIG
jgi:hypothetical protein